MIRPLTRRQSVGVGGIQREVVARTGLRDCRTHGRTWDLLRLTRMPTVQVDVGYITNPRDRDMLVSTPEEYSADIDKEETKWSALIKQLGLRVE